MRKVAITILASLALLTNISAQEDWMLYRKPLPTSEPESKELNFNTQPGDITINQDARIDSLMMQLEAKPFIMGYTIQIGLSQIKTEIRDAKLKFMKAYSDIPLFDEYKKPNTYLYAGSFYDRNDAYNLKHKIRHDFPDAIVIQKKMDLPNKTE